MLQIQILQRRTLSFQNVNKSAQLPIFRSAVLLCQTQAIGKCINHSAICTFVNLGQITSLSCFKTSIGPQMVFLESEKSEKGRHTVTFLNDFEAFSYFTCYLSILLLFSLSWQKLPPADWISSWIYKRTKDVALHSWYICAHWMQGYQDLLYLPSHIDMLANHTTITVRRWWKRHGNAVFFSKLQSTCLSLSNMQTDEYARRD